jgi:hypothetical protein
MLAAPAADVALELELSVWLKSADPPAAFAASGTPITARADALT